MAGPDEIDFVDDQARRSWQQFIEKTRAATGGRATADELSPRFVRTYLATQRDTMIEIQKAVEEIEKKFQG